MSEIHPAPIPFSLDAEVWAPASLFSFSFVVLPEAALQGSPRVPLPLPSAQPAHTRASSYSLHSKM